LPIPAASRGEQVVDTGAEGAGEAAPGAPIRASLEAFDPPEGCDRDARAGGDVELRET
jgi:hypothetical protein